MGIFKREFTKIHRRAESTALEVTKIGIHNLPGGVPKSYLQNFDIFVFWAMRGVQSPILGYFWPILAQNGQI